MESSKTFCPFTQASCHENCGIYFKHPDHETECCSLKAIVFFIDDVYTSLAGIEALIRHEPE